ncbi:hypothetical protein K488DRAFT_82298 [Vararia minispora EC-137]|uniref:Uncharacterized protein n=1 Tax=Vararia minispora EC-137 TaxID=1314806 RepID=A0ACB8QWC3_9AGAM|nr:hypothetical protein K488DRAFT_82298 [Vararia minispora EC-137]
MSPSEAKEGDKAASPPVIDKPIIMSTDSEAKETTDAAIPQKREREVSLEPATPHPDDTDAESVRMREKDARTPAKKNRTHLSTTEEEHDADVEAAMHRDASPDIDAEVPDAEPVSGSPPHETKMRQISQGVEDINWDKKQPPLLMTPNTDAVPLAPETTGVVNDSSTTTPPPEDTDDATATVATTSPQSPPESSGAAKRLRDGAEDDVNPRQTQQSTPPPADTRPHSSPKADGNEASTPKRPRDDADKDDNPRLTKRPTPPPADEPPVTSESTAVTAAPVSAPVPAFAGGFLAYASTSSPFANVKGPPLFGGKSRFTSPFASGATSPVPSPFASMTSTSFPATNPSPPASPKLRGAQTPVKRTGFEAFASQSPFAIAAARARSPERSKSPVRRGNSAAASKAFSAYATGGAQGLFGTPSAPAAKRARAESAASVTGDTEKDDDEERKRKSPSRTPEDGEERVKEDAKSFREQLRGDGTENGNGHAAAESSVWGEAATSSMEEQDVLTGEEDEMPVCSVRGKLFVLNGQNQWKERGTGTIRLNVKCEDESTPRLVMRKDAVLSVLLNAPLFKGMHCSIAQDPRYIRVSAIEAGSLTHYNIRVGSSTAAEMLHKAITAWTPGNDDQLTLWKKEQADTERLGSGRRY